MGSAAKMAQRQASALSKKTGSKGKFKDDLDSEVEADEEEEAEEEEEE